MKAIAEQGNGIIDASDTLSLHCIEWRLRRMWLVTVSTYCNIKLCWHGGSHATTRAACGEAEGAQDVCLHANPITPNQQRRRPNWAPLTRGRAFLTACANILSLHPEPAPWCRLRETARVELRFRKHSGYDYEAPCINATMLFFLLFTS